MVFEEFEYKRPNYEQTRDELGTLLDSLRSSGSAGEAIRHAVEIDKIRMNYHSMKDLSGLQFSIDLNNASYVAENDYFDDYWPYFKELDSKFYREILNSKYLADFRGFYGDQFIKLISCILRVIDPCILEQLQEEQRLVSSNFRTKTNGEIEFRGQKLNLSALSGYLDAPDRALRKEASDAFYGFYQSVADEIESCYDGLVRVRDEKAKKLGYPCFTPMGYDEMTRTDYDQDMVAVFREEVEKYMSPLSQKLIERQKKRLGVTSLPFYDEPVKFAGGNPRPKGDYNDLLREAGEMYREISPETGEYFSYMLENHLIDVLPRKGKEGGAFEQYIGRERAPFLFANCNGSSDDVKLVTHEAGHAFQFYMSRQFDSYEAVQPTMEAAEVDALSMEMFVLPYVGRFFDTPKDADKYRFMLLESKVHKVPYCCVVDEFQHNVYNRPQATRADRRGMWRELEKKYMPHRDYSGSPFLESGAWWFQQGHPFFRPFYFIDYGLAEICSLEFFQRMTADYSSAWQDYVRMCRLGGTRSFTQLLKVAKIDSPFERGTVRRAAEFTEEYLSRIDDTSF